MTGGVVSVLVEVPEGAATPVEQVPPELFRGAFGGPPAARPQYREFKFPEQDFLQKFNDLNNTLNGVFGRVGSPNDAFELETVELTVTINAEGGLSILGLGQTKIGAETGITLTYRRR